jgi:hypothetical protein
MKVIIEAYDLALIRKVAKERYGTLLTNAQAKKIIKANQFLQTELLLCNKDAKTMDTAGEDEVGQAIVNLVLGDKKPEVADTLTNGICDYFYWPMMGSSDEYRRHFYLQFLAAAKAKGVKTQIEIKA